MSSVKDILGDNKKFLLLVIALFVVVLIAFGFGPGMYSSNLPLNKTTFTEARSVIEDGVDYQIVVKTNYGSITIDLYQNEAPRSVNSLLFLIGERYYDNLTFHKVIENFVIQTGDAKGDGEGNPGYSVPVENSNTSFRDYSVGMANASQFFIVLPDSNKRDFSGYTLVGQVVEGFAVVDSIARVSVDDDYKPKRNVTINAIQILE
jgi:cyclophilin family peptidyl-prolyl cis-trans isomerase